jgi:hypothetical protein
VVRFVSSLDDGPFVVEHVGTLLLGPCVCLLNKKIVLWTACCVDLVCQEDRVREKRVAFKANEEDHSENLLLIHPIYDTRRDAIRLNSLLRL